MLIHIFVETVIYLMNKKIIIFNIKNVVTVTFYQLNASSLSKSINFFQQQQKKKT